MSRLWGRKIKVQVDCVPDNLIPKGDSGSTSSPVPDVTTTEAVIFEQGFTDNEETVRILFDVNYPGISDFYVSDIILYNVDPKFVDKIQKSGAVVSLFAGYREANFGCIFKGWIYQVMWERENVINYKLTLRCVDGDKLFTVNNMVKATIDPRMRFNTRINKLLGDASRKVPMIEQPPDVAEFQPLCRQETFFKSVETVLKESYGLKNASKPANYSTFGSLGNVHIIDRNNPQYEKEAIVVSPNEGGLIGTPEQTIEGCNFVTLLNANIKLKHPCCVVRLENTSVRELQLRWGDLRTSSLKNLSRPDSGLLEYMVIGVRHIGDTRGSSWYTYVTGCNLTGAIPTSLEVARGVS